MEELMKLIENESVLLRSSNKEMILTNFRVIKETTNAGVVNYSSIFLDKISSVQFRSQQFKWLLYLGYFMCGVGILSALNPSESRWGALFAGLFVGAIFFLFYFLTRRQLIEICGVGSERINTLSKDTFEAAFEFIAAVEKNIDSEGMLEKRMIS